MREVESGDTVICDTMDDYLKLVSISTYRHAFGFILNLPAVHDVDPSVHDGFCFKAFE